MKINHEISLETELPLQSVQDFVVHWEINEHAGLKLNGILENSSWDTVKTRNYVGTEIIVILAKTVEQNGDGVLFRGLIQDVKLIWNHGVAMVCAEAASASIKLDEDAQRLFRSFQNPSLSYSDVAKQMVELGNGSVICTTERKTIEKPVICYQETIWEFLKRLASHQNRFIIPDIKTGRPNLWFGMRSGKQIELSLADCLTSVDIRKQYGSTKKGMNIKSYSIESRAKYGLGDWIIDNGEKLVIYAMKARMEQGDISFFFQLASNEDIKKETYYNETFTGMSLWGTVEEVRDETLRVTFDMDGIKGDWFYPWRPETGNALYAMPEVGAKVSVCFMNHDEGTGVAVRCVGQQPENRKPENKSMMIPADGSAELFADILTIRKEKNKMKLNDFSNISINGEQIEIEANGKIKLKANRISLKAEVEIKATTE